MDNSKFPDELIKEMLSPPLLVPDALFADTGPVSPFAKATSSASDVLLVCKRWMRVGTPALYETVIIRSTAQAQALEMALTRNPEFQPGLPPYRLIGDGHVIYDSPRTVTVMSIPSPADNATALVLAPAPAPVPGLAAAGVITSLHALPLDELMRVVGAVVTWDRTHQLGFKSRQVKAGNWNLFRWHASWLCPEKSVEEVMQMYETMRRACDV